MNQNLLHSVKHGVIVWFVALTVIWAGTYFTAKTRTPDTTWLTAQSGDILTAEKRNNLVPTSAVIAFLASSCPTWRKPADGTDGTTDLRGQFLRWINSFDNRSSSRSDWKQDPDGASRIFGSYEADQFKSHSHNYQRILNWSVSTSWRAPSTAWTDSSQSTLSAWWNETRGKNIGVIFCVKK